MLGLYTGSINEAEDYIFSVGRIRVMESALLRRFHFERVAESRSVEGAWEALRDATRWWEKGIVGDHLDIEILLKERLEQSIREVSSMMPTAPIARAFAIRWDFLLLKDLARRYALGDSAEPERLERMLEEADFLLPGAPPLDYSEAVAKLSGALTRETRPHVVDRFLDAEMFHVIFRRLSEHPVPFARQFFSLRVDLLNLSTAFRGKLRNADRQEVQAWLIPGGTLPHSHFLEASSGGGSGGAASLAAVFAGTSLEGLLDPLQQVNDESEIGHRLEQRIDDHMTEFVHSAKYLSFGPEPLIGYLHGVEMEVKNVRRILSGISRSEDSESILADLRRPYV